MREAHAGRAHVLSRTLDFDAPHPRAFGAPAASSAPLIAGGFTGDVTRGGSCNCRTLSLVPHCNGTHTESVAHLTRDALHLGDMVPLQALPALLLSVVPQAAAGSGETAEPPPRPGDRLVTARALLAAWAAAAATPAATLPAPRVLVIRTGAAADDDGNPPYLSLEAMRAIVERDIDHLVVELPSVDRSEDDGRLAGHRCFFGLPAGSTRLADARRAHATITELASVPAACSDGPCLVQLQLADWSGDAVPSRPVLFELLPT